MLVFILFVDDFSDIRSQKREGGKEQPKETSEESTQLNRT